MAGPFILAKGRHVLPSLRQIEGESPGSRYLVLEGCLSRRHPCPSCPSFSVRARSLFHTCWAGQCCLPLLAMSTDGILQWKQPLLTPIISLVRSRELPEVLELWGGWKQAPWRLSHCQAEFWGCWWLREASTTPTEMSTTSLAAKRCRGQQPQLPVTVIDSECLGLNLVSLSPLVNLLTEWREEVLFKSLIKLSGVTDQGLRVT